MFTILFNNLLQIFPAIVYDGIYITTTVFLIPICATIRTDSIAINTTYSLKRLFNQNQFTDDWPNVGSEPSKGSDLYQETHKLVKKELPNDFIGNVEGRHLLDSPADILICDGFVGNTILKFAESWVNLFIRQLNKQIMGKRSYQMVARMLQPVFTNLKKLYDYEEFGGVPLLGVNGVVIVSHGNSSPKAVKNSLLAAKKCITENLLGDIQHAITEHMVVVN